MTTLSFKEWLIKEKNMSDRSARDVISRQKRIKKILNTNSFDAESLGLLVENELFSQLSICIRSQLKRTIFLSIEYQKLQNK